MKRIVLICGAVLFVVAGMFPPWVNTGLWMVFEHPQGYVEVDFARLGLEWLCIAVLTAALWYCLPKAKGQP